jgi:hypothetical protein
MTNTKKWHDHDGATMVSSCVKNLIFEEARGELTKPTFLMHRSPVFQSRVVNIIFKKYKLTI